jgi:hypothetical protein
MIKVFLGGSRKIPRLAKPVRERIDTIVKKGLWVLVGDANGADKTLQKYLAEKNYRKVTVFCSGNQCRNNIGNWEIHKVKTERKKKDFLYFVAKDIAMCDEADYGFMLWDGKSKGTLNNVMELLGKHKDVVVYFSPKKSFLTLRAIVDIQKLFDICSPNDISNIVRELEQLRINPVCEQLSFA